MVFCLYWVIMDKKIVIEPGLLYCLPNLMSAMLDFCICAGRNFVKSDTDWDKRLKRREKKCLI